MKKHGYRTRGKRIKEYTAWSQMKQRCLNPNHRRYKDYGGRGITVCERWFVFDNFLTDMGLAPSPKHTLERIENEKGYCKENCKWATWFEQVRNKRTNNIITHNGETRTFQDWCNTAGLNRGTVRKRVTNGWDFGLAISTKPRRTRGDAMKNDGL